MRLNKLSRFLVVLISILGLTISVASCSKKSDPSPEVEVAPPTAEQVMGMLNKAMDSKVSKDEKVALVEDASKDPAIFDKLQEFKKANPKLEFEIGAITKKKDGNVKVQLSAYTKGKADVDSKQGPFGVDLIYVDGQWQLAKNMVCRLLGSSNPPIKSAICV